LAVLREDGGREPGRSRNHQRGQEGEGGAQGLGLVHRREEEGGGHQRERLRGLEERGWDVTSDREPFRWIK
jgi:hypothetical protein